MTEHAIAVRLERDRIAVETMVDDPDFKGVANTSYIDADAAIRLGEGLIHLGRLARGRLAREMARSPTVSVPAKVMTLAVPTDLYPEDRLDR